MRNQRPAGMPAIPGQKKKKIRLAAAIAAAILFVVVLTALVVTAAAGVAGYVFQAVPDLEEYYDSQAVYEENSYYTLTSVPYYDYIDDDEERGQYDPGNYIAVDQIIYDNGSTWGLTDSGMYILIVPDDLEQIQWTQCDLFEAGQMYTTTQPLPLYYSLYMVGTDEYETTSQNTALTFDSFLQDNTGRVVGVLNNGLFVAVQDPSGTYLEKSGISSQPVTYVSYYDMKVRQLPDKDSKKTGTIKANSLVSIVDTKKTEDSLWGQMYEGGWICIYDQHYQYLSEY